MYAQDERYVQCSRGGLDSSQFNEISSHSIHYPELALSNAHWLNMLEFMALAVEK